MNNDSTKKTVLLISTLGSFLTPFMGSSINIALPSIAGEFCIDAVQMGWIATSYLLAAAMFLVPFGKAADIYGRKKVFSLGMLVYALSSFLCSVSASAPMLIFFRVLQGAGGAMIFGTGVAILTSVFPPEERGKALGINTAAVYLGLSLGPFLGGLLTQRAGWRSIFVVNAALSLAVVLITLWKLKGEWAGAKGEKLDLPGSVTYSVSLVCLMYGFSRLPAVAGGWLLLAGILGIWLFVKQELRTEYPVLNIRLLRDNKVFTFSNAAALVNYSATSAVGFLLSVYLQSVKSLTPQQAGLVLISQPIVMAVFSPFAGRLSDRVEPRIVASAGMALTMLGLVFFIFMGEGTPVFLIAANLVLLGFGFALFSSPNTNAVMGSVEKKFYGVASATLGTMRLTGQMLSMGVTMMVFAVFIGRVRITPAQGRLFISSSRMLFFIFAVLCFAGIFASLARGKVRN